MYTLEELKADRNLWKNIHFIPARCNWCSQNFEIKYGTLYNIIRRDAEGIYCNRKCAGSARANATQEKYKKDGGKLCKRCNEFKYLNEFSSLPSPPYLRAECKRCHNYKPARQYGLYRDKSSRLEVDFKLSLDQFLVFWKKPCFYCGSEVKTIRLELLDLKVGYIFDNIVSCCRGCQKFKDKMKHDEFINLCYKISNNVKDSGVRDG